MARRTLDHSLVSVYFKGMHDSPRIPLEGVGEAGLLQLFNEWAQVGSDLSSTARRIHTSIGSVKHFSHGILVEISTGAWGDPKRRLIDHKGGTDPRDIDEDDAATVTTRALLLAPPGGEIGLWFIEREGNQAGGSRVWSSFDPVVRAAPKVLAPTGELRGLIPKRVIVTKGEEWASSAELRKVDVSVYSPKDELGDDEDFIVRDFTRRTVLGPHDKTRFYPRNIRDQVFGLESKLEAAEFFGVPVEEGEDVDSVKFTIGDGEDEKTFEMDSPASPQLRLVLNENGESSVDERTFLQRCGALAEGTYRTLDQSFDYDWLR
ncbi:MAG: hypothetical protein L0G94_17570 [Brachybacterium sp.]|uniref:hypothetical protein n=1 Tax=Brachybacterium sp. TaxID=1891286 RepID=UPI00264729EE|nr:hypothetical protein [Brachybacterium sp.]MDN5688466.1 hypothetical protein [Brachybacterium sp.]